MSDSHDQTTVAVASYLHMRHALSGAGRCEVMPLLPWHIARYAAGDPDVDSSAMAKALRQDISLYRFYRALLDAHAFGMSPRQAAAQSLALTQRREGEGFSLEFRASRAQADQVYVTLSIDTLRVVREGAQVQLHVLTDEDLLRLEFPPMVGHRSQRLFLSGSPELSMLCRNDSELILVMS